MKKFSRWQSLLVISLVAILLLAGARSALASDIVSGDVIHVGAGEVIDDDLIVFGNTIVIDGTVNGDLVAFGNDVTVNGVVNGSSVLAGQRLNVSGTVKGTLYSGGSALHLGPNAVIERNLMFGGYSLQTEAGSVITRDLSMGGVQAVLAGKVGRDAQFGGRALELNGEIGRNLRAEVQEPGQIQPYAYYGANLPAAIATGLRVAQNAKIGGQLTYASPSEQSNAILNQPVGGVVYQVSQFDRTNAPNVPSPYEWLFTRIRDFFTVLILGALALWIIPQVVRTAAANAERKPLGATGWGLVVCIAGFVIGGMAFVAIMLLGTLFGLTTLGGLSVATFGVGFTGLGLVVTIFTGIVLWGAKVIVSMMVGKLILQRIASQYAENGPVTFLLGLVLFEIVASIPIFGAFVTLIVMLLGVGAMWYVYYERRSTPQISMPTQSPMPA